VGGAGWGGGGGGGGEGREVGTKLQRGARGSSPITYSRGGTDARTHRPIRSRRCRVPPRTASACQQYVPRVARCKGRRAGWDPIDNILPEATAAEDEPRAISNAWRVCVTYSKEGRKRGRDKPKKPRPRCTQIERGTHAAPTSAARRAQAAAITTARTTQQQRAVDSLPAPSTRSVACAPATLLERRKDLLGSLQLQPRNRERKQPGGQRARGGAGQGQKNIKKHRQQGTAGMLVSMQSNEARAARRRLPGASRHGSGLG